MIFHKRHLDADGSAAQYLGWSRHDRQRRAVHNYLESEVKELMKAVSHAYVRGRFHVYSG
jgi:hypothetical protein